MPEPQSRNLFGWGRTGVAAPQEALDRLLPLLGPALGIAEFPRLTAPDPAAVGLREPRFDPPDAIAALVTADRIERLLHTYGQSFRDTWRKLRGDFRSPPDYVAIPNDEAEVEALMRVAGEHAIALVPFGGGTSVVGGLECDASRTISVDLRRLDRILQIDRPSRSARIQAGIFGPALEAGLKPEGLTLRHYPQSFEFSTLGGWIATHAGGHFSTRYTHIDDFVQSVRMVTPSGMLETPRLPFDGAGPRADAAVLGSEGGFGIITEAWMRLQDAPVHRGRRSVRFPDFASGLAAARSLAQSGLEPANARLIDPFEAFGNGAGDGSTALLVLAFESAAVPVEHDLDAALSICAAHDGVADPPRDASGTEDWKQSFIRAPYLRDALVARGLVVETFETATTWDRFESLDRRLREAVVAAAGGAVFVTCRFTHLYADGPAPYYTVIAGGDPDAGLETWNRIKAATLDVLLDEGAAITHHHAVGRDHRNAFEARRKGPGLEALRATKAALDPGGVMNPGVLFR